MLMMDMRCGLLFSLVPIHLIIRTQSERRKEIDPQHDIRHHLVLFMFIF